MRTFKTLQGCVVSVGIVSLSYCPPSLSDEFHYNNVLVGDRAAGLGGAYTAVSDDASGQYYNPAGIGFAREKLLSASVNAYNRTETHYRSVLNGNDYDRYASSLVPNYFGIVQPLEKGSIGFSYVMTDSVLEDQMQRFFNLPTAITGVTATETIINFDNKDTTYLAGPSYGVKIDKEFAFGATLYLHKRDRKWISNQIIKLDSGQDELTNSYYRTEEMGFRPILGVMWTPVDQISLGATIGKTYIMESNTTYQVSRKPVTGSTAVVSYIETDEKREMPLGITVGAAWFPSEVFLVSADLSYSGSTRNTFLNRKSTINGALGIEYYLDEAWAWRGGIFTDYAATERIDPTLTNQPEHVDLVGVATSLTKANKNASITVGAVVKRGSGQAQLFGNSTTVTDVDRQSFTLFLSASTAN